MRAREVWTSFTSGLLDVGFEEWSKDYKKNPKFDFGHLWKKLLIQNFCLCVSVMKSVTKHEVAVSLW